MRQLQVIEPWAVAQGVTLLPYPVVDEGTSASKLDPFERPKFLAACERARMAGANAIVVECGHRFSRQGAKRDSWAEVELERRYELRLLRADKSLEQHGSMVGAVTDTIHAEGARAWVRAHSSKVRTGWRRRRPRARATTAPRTRRSTETPRASGSASKRIDWDSPTSTTRTSRSPSRG